MDLDRELFGDLIERLDHVAIAVPSIQDALPLFAGLGASYFAGTDQIRAGFRWVQFNLGDGSKLELIAPLTADSFVQRFLDERGPGLHHLTFKVTDVSEASQRARAAGYKVLGPNLSPSWSEMFIHPANPLGTLIQFAEWPSDKPWTQFSLEDVLAGRAVDDS
ncbi:methylmalonyl-CoA epimerase [soil metagenome]